MFTKNNTMNEILNTEPVGRAAGNLFPTCFMARVPVEHRDHTMAQIEKLYYGKTNNSVGICSR